MNRHHLLICLISAFAICDSAFSVPPGRFTQPDAAHHPDLFTWTDTCNVHVLRDGDAALLIDLGDGSVLDHLGEIGVKRVEWILFTGHHRELLQGVGRRDRGVMQIAAPKEEQAFLETPNLFRKWHPRNGDKFTVLGASYVRPPQSAVKVDRWLAGAEVFEWRRRSLQCLATPGHSPGGMSFVLKNGTTIAAFIGGGMHVPLVIAGPGIPKGRSDALVYLMDLFPTFADFAGAKNPDGVEGKSIVPILAGKQTKVRDVLYTAYRDCQRAIRDDRWKLIRYPLVNRTQLFDLSADPHELNNLADKPEHKAKLAELTALLQKEMASHADKSPLIVANPKPAEWTPPAAGGEPAKKIRKKVKQ